LFLLAIQPSVKGFAIIRQESPVIVDWKQSAEFALFEAIHGSNEITASVPRNNKRVNLGI
jgi:hypothetical protein